MKILLSSSFLLLLVVATLYTLTTASRRVVIKPAGGTEEEQKKCQLLSDEPQFKQNNKRRVLISPDNVAAIEFEANLVLNKSLTSNSPKVIPLIPTAVEYEHKQHWEILKLKTDCIDIEVLFINSTFFKSLSLGYIELSHWKGSPTPIRVKNCNVKTNAQDRVGYFKNGFQCSNKNREFACDDLLDKNVGTVKLNHLKVEFWRNSTAPKDNFESKSFVQCLSESEAKEVNRKAEERRKKNYEKEISISTFG